MFSLASHSLLQLEVCHPKRNPIFSSVDSTMQRFAPLLPVCTHEQCLFSFSSEPGMTGKFCLVLGCGLVIWVFLFVCWEGVVFRKHVLCFKVFLTLLI